MRFIIFPGSDDVLINMFYELFDSPEEKCIVEKGMYKWGDSRVTKIRNMLSYHIDKLGRLIDLFDIVLWPIMKLKRYLNCDEEVCYVFSNLTIRLIPDLILKRLLKQDKTYIVIYLIDSSSQPLCEEAIKKTQKHKFNLVYTFDSEDAKKFDFIHFYYIYSKLKVEKRESIYDIAFWGSNKGRLTKLLDFANCFEKNDIKYYMSIIDVDLKEMQQSESIDYNRPLSYSDMIDSLQEAQCILDIVIDEQSGLSLRAIEAVCYNKKLITNNKNIFKFPFYNEKYMQYVSAVDEIDFRLLKENISVDYKYNDDFSPYSFLEDINSRIMKNMSKDIKV